MDTPSCSDLILLAVLTSWLLLFSLRINSFDPAILMGVDLIFHIAGDQGEDLKVSK